jgi:hypothetical protein
MSGGRQNKGFARGGQGFGMARGMQANVANGGLGVGKK